MPHIQVTSRDGSTTTISAENGISLMENLKAAGNTEVLALCGGCASCGTCHVHVAQDWADRLPPINEDEEEMLEFAPFRTDTSRLSCQIRVTDELDGLAITIAPDG